MSVREYIGARYVPVFADPAEWDATKTYEPLTVVLYQGNSYTSRQAVPANIPITNETYWAQTGNYNAQIEQYRQEVSEFDQRITQNASDIDTLEAKLPSTSFTSTNTIKKYVDDKSTALESAINTLKSNSLSYYNVRENGAVGDGTSDDFEAIQALLTRLHNDGGGVLYVPKGTYKLTKTLIVGDNTLITGDGKSSVFYGTDSSVARFGTCIGVTGSNVIIEKVNGRYDGDTQFYMPGSNAGFIGIGNYTFDSALAYSLGNSDDLAGDSHSHIIVKDIITDCSYPVQTENSRNINSSYTLTDVHYQNILAPNGVVSWQNNVTAKSVNNIYVDNVNCAILRSAEGYYCQAYVTNSYANIARFSSGPVFINNCVFDLSENSIVRNWIAAGNLTQANYILYANCGQLNNVMINGNGNDLGLNGLYLGAGVSENIYMPTTMNSVSVYGINSGRVLTTPRVRECLNATKVTNSNFGDDSNTTSAASTFGMYGNNTIVPKLIDTEYMYVYVDNYIGRNAIAATDGYALNPSASDFSSVSGKTLNFGGIVVCTGGTTVGTHIATTYTYAIPPTNVRVPCIFATENYSAALPGELAISAETGRITINSSPISAARYIYVPRASIPIAK